METVTVEEVDELEDLQWLKDTIEDYKEVTGSEVAERLLQNWPASASELVKVSLLWD